MKDTRVIVALSGGKASAWCAGWAIREYPESEVVLYFNDTLWEHPDLYRFLSDLGNYFGKTITRDTDGRSPESVFRDEHALANSRMPFCSKILKAKRLQQFYQEGDHLVFGIGCDEPKRVKRIISRYQVEAARMQKFPILRFPLVEAGVSGREVDNWLQETGIPEPELYRLGFTHNNCSGGCVAAGKRQWKRLLEKLPNVYRERERELRRNGERPFRAITLF